MIPPKEAEVQRKLTSWFVDADVEEVTLERPARISDGAGGWVNSFQPWMPQRMRLVPGAAPVERLTSDGLLVTPNYTLLGLYGASMERFDRFTLGGVKYEIVFVHENREYQTKGEVISIE